MGFDCVTFVFFFLKENDTNLNWWDHIKRLFIFVLLFSFFSFKIQNMLKLFGKNKQDGSNDYKKGRVYKTLKSKFTPHFKERDDSLTWNV
jgi:hypothetical protein